MPADKRLALISFGGFGLGDFDFSPLGRLDSWVFLSEPALAGTAPNLRVIPPAPATTRTWSPRPTWW